MSAPVLWLVAAILSAVIELASPSFGFVFVTAASLVAAIGAALGAGFAVQASAFSATLILSLIFLRPRLVSKLVSPGVPSRTEALVGRVGCVTESIDPVLGQGRIIVGGEDWAARSAVAIPVDAQIRIDGADGIVLQVSPLPETQRTALKEEAQP